MEILVNPSKQEWKSALQRPLIENKQLETTVQEIMEQVKNNGDAAVLRYSQQFDNPNVNKLEVSFAEIEAAQHSISPDLKHAIVTAIKNIQTFHERQEEIPSVTETMYGVKCWRKSVPIEKVGLYIPGGSAPLFSTILML
ncbi:MAG TPA: histidinol dehydrogenase, partial [Bacteroidales bacterium]|nr:histidinol dehydrogenase [Bacteroidales bacterium]